MSARVYVNGVLTETTNTINLPAMNDAAVTVRNTGTLTGSIGEFGGTTTMTGGSFANVSSGVGYNDNVTVINANVTGAGVWALQTYHGDSGKLEFMKPVSTLQTVSIGQGERGYATLELAQPTTFHGSIDWESGDAAIDLDHLAADSYSYRNGVLDFWHGSRLVDTLRFSSAAPAEHPWAVAQGTSTGGSGVEIYSLGYVVPPHGAALPLHG